MTEYSPMLAPSKIANVPNLDYPILIQPKFDGFRATYVPNIGFISRTGKTFPNKNLENYFSSLQIVQDVVLDGELFIPHIPFQDLSRTLTAENAKIGPRLRFVVFDAVPLEDWNKRSCGLEYSSRLTLLRKVVNSVCDYPRVMDCGTDKVTNMAQLLTIYNKYLTDGLEGAMIKTESGLYKWGRVGASKQVLKLKPFKSVDLKVIGIFDGKGKFEGSAGGIICDFNGSPVRCGTGFSNSDRIALAKDKDSFIGKVAEIKYFEKTKNGKSLRQPVFSRWRLDK